MTIKIGPADIRKALGMYVHSLGLRAVSGTTKVALEDARNLETIYFEADVEPLTGNNAAQKEIQH